MKKIAFAILSTVMTINSAANAETKQAIHDGAQFRYAGGVGYLNGNESGKNQFDGEYSGTSFVNLLTLGIAPVPGLFIGGFAENTYLSNPTSYVEGVRIQSAPGAYLNLWSLGMYMDMYPNPSGGGHIFFAGGYSIVSFGNDLVSRTVNGDGYNVSGGIGHDWHVGNNWNVGLLAKVSYTEATSRLGKIESNERIIVPALMFTVSFH